MSCALVISRVSIELGLTRSIAPMVVDLVTDDARDDKLTVLIMLLAHHAGYLRRIHWGLPHCARDIRDYHPIGLDVNRHPIGQGVGRLPIGQ